MTELLITALSPRFTIFSVTSVGFRLRYAGHNFAATGSGEEHRLCNNRSLPKLKGFLRLSPCLRGENQRI